MAFILLLKLKMYLSLIITNNCSACKRAEVELKNFAFNNKEVYLNILDVNDFYGQTVSIVPALFADDQLISYGVININKLCRLFNSINNALF